MALNISTSDYQKLLQKIAVLETEIFQLKQSRGLKTPLWNRLGAKPKEIKERITGRTHSPVVTDLTGWPALPARHSASTPLQQWSTAKGKKSAKVRIAKSPETLCVKLVNRFTPLLEDPRYLPGDSVSPSWLRMQLKEPSVSPRGVRSKNNSENKRLQGEKTPVLDPEILIVGDDAVKDVKNIRKAKVLCFPKDKVADINDKILDLVAANPTVKTIILHIGTCDIEEKKSEVLKQHFKALFATLKTLNSDVRVCISGPLPSMRGGDEYFSRLFALSQWLATACINESVLFIDNFGFFWDRKHLFTDGNKLNKRGIKLYAANMRYSLGITKARAHAVPSEPSAASSSVTERTQNSKTTDCEVTDNDATLEEKTTAEESSKTSDNGAELSAKATENSDCVEKSHLCELSDVEKSLPRVNTPSYVEPANDEGLQDPANDTTSPYVEPANDEGPQDPASTNDAEGSETAMEEDTPYVEPANDEGSQDSASTNDAEGSETAMDEETDSSSFDEGPHIPSYVSTPSNVEPANEGSETAMEEETDKEEDTDSSSFALSPMQLLEFSSNMNALVSTGIKMTPLAKRPAPQPPPRPTTQSRKSVAWDINPPPIPTTTSMSTTQSRKSVAWEITPPPITTPLGPRTEGYSVTGYVAPSYVPPVPLWPSSNNAYGLFELDTLGPETSFNN